MAAEAMQIQTVQPVSLTNWRTADEIKAMRSLVVQVMRDVMKDNIHYGTIPGCDKPSLWKPGAELLFATFRISVDPVVTNLSTPDEIRYQVMCHATSASGQPLGSSIGECSSSEEKYRWRRSVCQEEWDEAPDDRRRMKWKRGRQNSFYQQPQVRTEVADSANTVLKMALKRGFVGLALQVTAASDVFTQGIEDLPEEVREDMMDEYVQESGNQPTTAQTNDLPTEIRRKPAAAASSAQPAQRQSAPAPAPRPTPIPQTPKQPAVRVISEAQARRFYAIWKGAGKTKEEVDGYLHEVIRVQNDRDIPHDRYNEACAWAERRQERW